MGIASAFLYWEFVASEINYVRLPRCLEILQLQFHDPRTEWRGMHLEHRATTLVNSMEQFSVRSREFCPALKGVAWWFPGGWGNSGEEEWAKRALADGCHDCDLLGELRGALCVPGTVGEGFRREGVGYEYVSVMKLRGTPLGKLV